jgi:hypothetical protein
MPSANPHGITQSYLRFFDGKLTIGTLGRIGYRCGKLLLSISRRSRYLAYPLRSRLIKLQARTGITTVVTLSVPVGEKYSG